MAKHTPPHRPKKRTQPTSNTDEPVFAQPQPSPDPTTFKDPVTDQSDSEINNLEPVPQSAGGAAEPILTLAQVYGSAGAAKVQASRIRHRLCSIPSETRAASSDPIRNPWWPTRWSLTSMRRTARMYRRSSSTWAMLS